MNMRFPPVTNDDYDFLVMRGAESLRQKKFKPADRIRIELDTHEWFCDFLDERQRKGKRSEEGNIVQLADYRFA